MATPLSWLPPPTVAAPHHRPQRRGRATGLLLAGLGALAGLRVPGQDAQAGMLDVVKQNPALARSLCERFKALNAAGESATSKQAIAQVAASQGLSTIDAEVLTTYVIGLHCPEVR